MLSEMTSEQTGAGRPVRVDLGRRRIMGGLAGHRLGLAAALLLAACAGTPPAPPGPPPPPAAGMRAVPLGFGELKANVRRGTPIGQYEVGVLCKPPYDDLSWRADHSVLSGSAAHDRFFEALHDQGYAVTGDPTRLFDRDRDLARAELLVSAQFDDLSITLCRRYNIFFESLTSSTAEGMMRVNWTLYSRLERKVLYQTSTTGFARVREALPDAAEVAMERAFADAAERLGRDAGFRRLAFVPAASEDPAARRPPAEAPPAPPLAAPPAGLAEAPDLPLPLNGRPPARAPLPGHGGMVADAAVLVASGAGHGSGFFLADDPAGASAWVLSCEHVVGEAEQVRVVLASGEARVGRVVRRDRPHDVALIRVAGAAPAVLPVRPGRARVGEEVYAVGAPLRERLRRTLTRGIVSAHRRNPLTGLPRLQTDVTVQEGSSGGPLVDASGNVLGLIAEAVTLGDRASLGLNSALPIGESLAALRIVLTPAAPAAGDGLDSTGPVGYSAD
jgi:S1-C subfamily serine protease